MDARIDPADARYTQLVRRLQASGYRLTPQRLALLRLLASDDSHPSADQIFARLRQAFPTVSLATVYNTLDVLVELGEALPLGLNEGSTRYDVRRPVAHPHVVCRRCGQVADLEVEGLVDFVETARQQTSFGDLQPHIHFEGICPGCVASPGEPREV